MRQLALALALAQTLVMTPASGFADPIRDLDWQLLAIDGLPVDLSVTASLRIDAAGFVTGMAPCNSYGAQNMGALPVFKLGPIRSTRMACDKLADERVFFDTLALMETLVLDGDRNLVLTGPDGRSLEFVADRTDSQTPCKTCRASE